jgi:tetratricopeptide (TPR) repeat protein
MPGFRSLSDALTGSAADLSREAAALEESGDHAGAIAMFERALAASLADRAELPGFVCGRLAASYRRAGRYQDELDLLERYRDSQTDEDARSRFDARLSKARALADKHHRRDSAALASVRAIKPSARRGRRSASNGDHRDAPPPES